VAKIINITDRLNNEKPKIIIGEKTYDVDNSMLTVLRFEEILADPNSKNMIKAFDVALGEKAAKELEVEKMPVENFKVIFTAIAASMQGLEYEEAEKRFRKEN
jgi:hypothetical protein